MLAIISGVAIGLVLGLIGGGGSIFAVNSARYSHSREVELCVRHIRARKAAVMGLRGASSPGTDVALVEDLMLELTRAANYVCDRVREFLLRSYRIRDGLF